MQQLILLLLKLVTVVITNNCNLPLAILEACRLDCYSVSVNEVPVYPKKKAIIFFNKVGSWIGEIKRKRFHLHYS